MLMKFLKKLQNTANTVLSEKDEKDIAKRIEDLKEDLLNGDGLMLSGNPISPEAIESLIEALSSGIRQAKIANKKYTPKKSQKIKSLNLRRKELFIYQIYK